MTPELFLRWKVQRPGAANRQTWSYRLSHVRTFARWLHSLEPRTVVPPPGLVPRNRRRPQPYIYTDEEVADIVAGAARLPSRHGLRGPTYAALFGLLAVTGLRIGEAVALDERGRGHRRSRAACPPCQEQQEPDGSDHLMHRRTLGVLPVVAGPDPSRTRHPGVLPRRSWATDHEGFGGAQLRARRPGDRPARSASPRAVAAPVPACTTCATPWPFAPSSTGTAHGLDPDREMYKLSAWLGHGSPDETYWYLEAVPELLHLATERAERAITGGNRHEGL